MSTLETDSYEPEATPDTVWAFMQESAKRMEQSQRAFDQRMKQSRIEFDRSIEKSRQEAAQERKEYAQRMEERDKKFEQQRRQDRKKMNQLERLFISQWGKLVESLIEGDLVNILNRQGITINDTTTRLKGRQGNDHYEFDIIAHNGDEVVVVEVKTTLRPDDVNHFAGQLAQFKQWIQLYREKQVYGAVAFLRAEGQSEIMAQKRGLFVIRATGNSAAIINNDDFQPKCW